MLGRRGDGLHDLDSLVVFAEIGDVIEARGGKTQGLTIDGRFAGGLDPADPGNLVTRAAGAFVAAAGRERAEPAFRLVKNLPVASGLGGGSADAAATLRLLNRLSGAALPAPQMQAVAERLGADVPMCLVSSPLHAGGAGESLRPLSGVPALPMVLVYPGVGVSTRAAFEALEPPYSRPLPSIPDRFDGPAAVAAWLTQTGNDLEPAARRIAPAIDEALEALRATDGCLLARMSGSGSTCFAIHADAETARDAAATIASRRGDWWVEATATRPG